ncbi:unnamed protein product [Prunus armeniaca]|uniref:Uncharacterized protein n=1 Tax=Prunus armeniaca TaxID=36596 RepID=A0A6J5VX65_PRUAR|nr:unnamed protein product [Prunus armeniaca]
MQRPGREERQRTANANRGGSGCKLGGGRRGEMRAPERAGAAAQKRSGGGGKGWEQQGSRWTCGVTIRKREARGRRGGEKKPGLRTTIKCGVVGNLLGPARAGGARLGQGAKGKGTGPDGWHIDHSVGMGSGGWRAGGSGW